MNNELYHHGVKGMKWGVRQKPEYKYNSHNSYRLRSSSDVPGLAPAFSTIGSTKTQRKQDKNTYKSLKKEGGVRAIYNQKSGGINYATRTGKSVSYSDAAAYNRHQNVRTRNAILATSAGIMAAVGATAVASTVVHNKSSSGRDFVLKQRSRNLWETPVMDITTSKDFDKYMRNF